MTCGLFPLGWLKIEIQQVGFGQCDTQISGGYKVGHKKPIVINRGTWDPYKCPKINGFPWGYSTLLVGLYNLNLQLGYGVHLVVTVVEFPKLRIFVPPFWT